MSAEWDDGTDVYVEWEHSMDASVRGYHVYISEDMFTSTDEAVMVGQTVSANSFTITTEEFDGLNNATDYYIGVVAYDDTVAKSTVESVKLNALDGTGGSETGISEDGQLTLESLLTTPNLIAAGMFLVVIVLLVLVVRARGSANRRDKNWELQEATWGIQDASWDTPPLHLHRQRLHLRPAFQRSRPTTSTRQPTEFKTSITDDPPTKHRNPC